MKDGVLLLALFLSFAHSIHAQAPGALAPRVERPAEEVRGPAGYEPLRGFGTSGLLYRSNKLMIDRQTGTLWSNLSG